MTDLTNFEFLTPPDCENDFYWPCEKKPGSVIFILKENGMEVLRGGIVRAMSAWEALVVCLLRDAFINKLIYSAKDLEDIKKKWGTIASDSDANKGKDRMQVALDKALMDHCEKTLKRRCDDKKSVLETLHPENDWRKLLKEYHADPILNGDIRPVFGRSENSIDSIASKLFQLQDNTCILKLAIPKDDSHEPRRKFTFLIRPYDEPTEVNVSRRGLTCCSLLYYGFRCVLAHGIPNKTLNSGVLKDFDATFSNKKEKKEKLDVKNCSTSESAQKAFGVEDAREEPPEGCSRYKQAELLLKLRQNIENFKSDTDLSYQTWLNMCCYLQKSAMWLDKALDELIKKLPNL
ncbi:uncharacterized protein [Oscarella lobularis]|uniref:uncharacterized protein isoform X1 n=1 Tax=Oscarella lobularis TaxID=121494 RepID=UPI003313D617